MSDELKIINSESTDITILKFQCKGEYFRDQGRLLIFAQGQNLVRKGTTYLVGKDFPYEVKQNWATGVFYARKSDVWKDKV